MFNTPSLTETIREIKKEKIKRKKKVLLVTNKNGRVRVVTLR